MLTTTTRNVAVAALFLLASGCEKNDKPGSTHTSSAPNPASKGTTQVPSKPTGTDTAMPAATTTAAVKPTFAWKEGLSTPESVIHDDVIDVYLVSNVDGKPLDADGKGFIAKITPEGSAPPTKWIEGGKNKVTLNAPRGMAFLGQSLYVADLDTVRIFDRKTGAPIGEVKVPGASFLNDMTTTADGRVLVTDMGMKSGTKGFEPTGTDAVYVIDKDRKLTTLTKSKELGAPNGVLASGDKTWVSTFGSGELYSLDAKGKKGDAHKLPKGSLDGIVAIGDDVIVASWDAKAIFRGKPGGEMRAIIEDVKAPADIGYDRKRGRLLVPLFEDDEVRAYDVK